MYYTYIYIFFTVGSLSFHSVNVVIFLDEQKVLDLVKPNLSVLFMVSILYSILGKFCLPRS